MQPTVPRQATVKLLTTIAAVIIIAGLVVLADHLKSKTTPVATAAATPAKPPVNQTTQPSASNTTSSVPATLTSSYKDGTYTATSNYYVPHGYENIQVSLTIKDGVVTDSSITNSESDRDSAAYQEDFASQYKNYVIGKSVSGLKLQVTAGASDTTQGFNDAVSQITAKAHA